jgi:hypothetical protein
MMSPIIFAVQQEILDGLNSKTITLGKQACVNKFSLDFFYGVAAAVRTWTAATAVVWQMTPELEWHLDPSAAAPGSPDILDSRLKNRVSI